ncbi:alpha/beta fold hydrolase [Rubrobacter marinus]|uniref:Alpha/beta fold hydrolase n=2 Tax=Rubrobacter marinus TaxID=2653852 RepID=A0A6G8Q368_9ACTN|nr:alpha/beta fold hydrolase [Rubrobacter marinus]
MHARVPADPAPGGPAVVLVHGLVVSSRYMTPTLSRLAPRRRVYAPDLPGFGRSEKPPRALDVPGLARALDGWMEATGLGSAVLVGNSMGCQVIAELALRRPARVERAVLQGPTMDPEARTLPRQAARLALDCLREPPSLILVELLDLLAAGPLRSLRTFFHAADDRIEKKLPALAAPVLVVHGERDPIVPERWAREACGLLPDGRFVVVRGAAHAVNYNAPSALARHVEAFIGARP